MTWYKRLATKIQIILTKAEINENLQKLNIGLEKENTRLKDTIVEQTELVLQYKRGMQQMREYMSAIMQMEVNRREYEAGEFADSEFNEPENEEEEGVTDPYELLRKKTTIH